MIFFIVKCVKIDLFSMDIQRLSTFSKVFNYINIHRIDNKALTEKELNFINEMTKFVHPQISNNSRSMQ